MTYQSLVAVLSNWGGDFMKMDSREYFERRERAERAAAKNAASPQARRIHQELAQNYAELAHQQRGVAAPHQPLSIVTPADLS